LQSALLQIDACPPFKTNKTLDRNFLIEMLIQIQLKLSRMFVPKRGEVTGEWREFHNEELHILYSSANIIRKIKSRRMR
jgi:hypothetical protein